MSTSSVNFEVTRGDATETESDLLLVKYAQEPLGLDERITSLLVSHGACERERLIPKPGEFVIVDSHGALASSNVMFVGTPPIHKLGYPELHKFARRAMELLASRRFGIETITTTIHGVGYGLDAGESIQNLIEGFVKGLASWPLTIWIPRITFVERDERVFRIISSQLGLGQGYGSPRGTVREPEPNRRPGAEVLVAHREIERKVERPSRAVEPAGPGPAQKELIFVAMPYGQEFQDVYEFGIYAPVRRCGYICEKVDEASFAGDILERIKSRIKHARLVVADLTDARPNVYLEVGFAWGLGVPVVFLAKEGQALHFDVKSHKCIFYKTIGQLARDLERLIDGILLHGDSAR